MRSCARSRVLPALLAAAILWVSGLARAAAPAPPIAEFIIVKAPASDAAGPAELAAPEFLSGELAARGVPNLKITEAWPASDKPVIAIASRAAAARWAAQMGSNIPARAAMLGPEGFLLSLDTASRPAPTIWIIGADSRGALFGAGKLLRALRAGPGGLTPPATLDVATQPAYPVRGHQLGYRNRANSWDAWTRDQFEQYIRDLIVFGANSIEGIPFQDDSSTPLMKYSRRDMNRMLGEICAKYELQYWVWTPVEFDLTDAAKRAAELDRHAQFYGDAPRLDGVFFPGGDPGHNHADLVVPFLSDIAKRLIPAHPAAKVWLSLQWFGPEDQKFVYDWLDREKPDWFGGIVCGPSSPTPKETRPLLNSKYAIRDYPDVTHTIRCQHPVPDFDRAFALTVGREGVDVRPADSLIIHQAFAPLTNGFISYSDGVHDDVNKAVWSAAAWDPKADVRDIVEEYAEHLCNGLVTGDMILALERNWRGAASENGAVAATAAAYDKPDIRASGNWRVRMLRFRADYDNYERDRRRFEERGQREADAALIAAPTVGSDAAIARARAALGRVYADSDPSARARRDSLDAQAKGVFDAIKLQTSVPKFGASEPERGCMMDFVDHPMNDRLYYEFMFERIKDMPEAARAAELAALGNWTAPGPGGYYDDIGDVQNQPRVIAGETLATDPEFARHSIPEFTWANGGDDHRRLAWMDWQEIAGLRYEGLGARDYIVTAVVDAGPNARLTANGEKTEPLADPEAPPVPPAAGKFASKPLLKSWRIPASAIANGALELRWERERAHKPEQKSQNQPALRPALAEVWLRPAQP